MSEWGNELCGCFSNCGVCIVTFLLPCITAGKNAEAVGKDCCTWGFLSILGPVGIYTRATVRGRVREQKGIDGSFGNDCAVHWLCCQCALVQEANEL